MADERVEVAFAADRAYWCGLTVAACSLAASASRGVSLRVHLLHDGVPEDDRRATAARLKRFHPSTEAVFHDVGAADMSQFPEYAASRMTYARLLLPALLPDVGHVIYSDVDFLWMDDVAELWRLKETVSFVSCVPEASAKTLDQEEAWFRSENVPFDRSRYFCAGLSFYNLDAIRRRRAFDAVRAFARAHAGYRCADQSLLYGAFGGVIALLPARWQTLPRNGVTLPAGAPLVLHYAGEAPWKSTNGSHLLTDTQLLWFRVCALVHEETTWRSLRRFYPVGRLAAARALFLLCFRLPPVSRCVRRLMRAAGFGEFNETLPRRWRRFTPFR
jgi:lipopolysaccharide biosynthesis glycosyltransferase